MADWSPENLRALLLAQIECVPKKFCMTTPEWSRFQLYLITFAGSGLTITIRPTRVTLNEGTDREVSYASVAHQGIDYDHMLCHYENHFMRLHTIKETCEVFLEFRKLTIRPDVPSYPTGIRFDITEQLIDLSD